MDDIESNPLYKAFMTKYRREYETACKMSYIIAIPQSDSVDEQSIDQNYVNAHILMPSKLLRMHYTPLQAGYFGDIEIDGQKLICHRVKNIAEDLVLAHILAEEISIIAEDNGSNRKYTTILIDRPLVDPNSRTSLRSILSPLSFRIDSLRKLERKKSSFTHHDDCSKYLENISIEVTADLERNVKRLQTNYMILPHYIDDAVLRTKNLAENYILRYEIHLENSYTNICDSVRRLIRLSVENTIIHLLHGKLMTAVNNQYEKDERKLRAKFNEIRQSGLTICQLGAQSYFAEFVLTDDWLLEVETFSAQQSPIAIVSSLLKLVRMISESLNLSVKFNQLMGLTDDDKLTFICLDDLIATFVYAFARSKPNNLYSISKYLEKFGWSTIERDQAAYYTTAFQSVIQYVIGHNSCDLNNVNDPFSLSAKTIGRIREPNGSEHKIKRFEHLDAPSAVQLTDSVDSGESSLNETDSAIMLGTDSTKADWEFV